MTQRWALILPAAFVGMLLLTCTAGFLAVVFLDQDGQTTADRFFSIMVLLFGCTFGLLLVTFAYWRRIGLRRQPSNIWMQAGDVTLFACLGVAMVSWIAAGIISLIHPTIFAIARGLLPVGFMALYIALFIITMLSTLIGKLQSTRRARSDEEQHSATERTT